MLSFQYYGFLNYRGVIGLKNSLIKVEKVNQPKNDIKSNDLYKVIDQYINPQCTQSQEEQYGPVCAASSVATMTNQFTNANIDTNKVLEYFCKHQMGIIQDTCQFVNRNINKLKQIYEREQELERKIKENEVNNIKLNENQENEDHLPHNPYENEELILNFSAKDMNNKKTKKKIVKKSNKTKNKKQDELKDISNDVKIESESQKYTLDQPNTNDNTILLTETEESLIHHKPILEYPILDPKTLFDSFIQLKQTKTPLKEWYDQNIPEQEFKLKGPIKVKLKKIKDNFRKLSKLQGIYGNCSTQPIGTSIWHNCMMHACNTNKSDSMAFKAHKLVGTGGYRIELNKKCINNSAKLDDAWNEIKHQLKFVRKEDKERQIESFNEQGSVGDGRVDNANENEIKVNVREKGLENDEISGINPSQLLALHLSNHYALIYGYRVIQLNNLDIPEHLRLRRQVLCTRYGQRPKHWIDFDMTYQNQVDKKYKLSLAQTLCCFKTQNIVMVERVLTKNDKKKKAVFVNNDSFIQHSDKLDQVKSEYKDLTKEINKDCIKNEEQEQLMIEKGNLNNKSDENKKDNNDEMHDDRDDDNDSESCDDK